MEKKSKNQMNSCTVKLWYNKQRVKKSGNVSLYLQLIVARESIEIPLPMEWPVEYIDNKRKELLPRSPDDPDYLSYKAIIETERAKYWEIVRKFLLRGGPFKLTDIVKEARVYNTQAGILSYMEGRIKKRLLEKKKLKEKIKESTARIHRTSLKWLKKYLSDIDIPVSQINCNWIEEYALYLSEFMADSAIWCRIKDLKTYLQFAFDDKLPVDLDYMRYDNTCEESDPVWLEKNEIDELLKLYSDPQTMEVVRRDTRAFLFACFTGLRISDLKRWDKGWIDGDEFVFTPTKRRLSTKNKKPMRIPIIPLAQSFIDSLETDKFECISDQRFNERLKTIAKTCGIKKNLTTHVARHTFGTQLAYAGVPVLVISKLLGHKKTDTTMIYIHIAEKAKLMEMMKLQAAFENFGHKSSLHVVAS